jgi:hypothetical protein
MGTCRSPGARYSYGLRELMATPPMFPYPIRFSASQSLVSYVRLAPILDDARAGAQLRPESQLFEFTKVADRREWLLFMAFVSDRRGIL